VQVGIRTRSRGGWTLASSAARDGVRVRAVRRPLPARSNAAHGRRRGGSSAGPAVGSPAEPSAARRDAREQPKPRDRRRARGRRHETRKDVAPRQRSAWLREAHGVARTRGARRPGEPTGSQSVVTPADRLPGRPDRGEAVGSRARLRSGGKTTGRGRRARRSAKLGSGTRAAHLRRHRLAARLAGPFHSPASTPKTGPDPTLTASLVAVCRAGAARTARRRGIAVGVGRPDRGRAVAVRPPGPGNSTDAPFVRGPLPPRRTTRCRNASSRLSAAVANDP